METGVAAFLRQFVHPLVTGGEVIVGAPIDTDTFIHFSEQLAEASHEVDQVDSAREDVVAELVLKAPNLIFGDDELALCAAVHNLLFMSHPRARGRAKKYALASAQYLANRPLSGERASALSRHSLLHNLFAVSRRDVKVSWWLGSATFVGQAPPSRLTKLKTIRRVREEHLWVGFNELFRASPANGVMTAILRRTPLTSLLAGGMEGTSIRFEDAAFLLRDAELSRAIAYAAIQGKEAEEILERPAVFGAAFEQMLERRPKEADVRAVASFLVYLNTLLVAIDGLPPLTPERLVHRIRGLSTFLALPAAMERVDPRLAEMPGIGDDPQLGKRWRTYRSEVTTAVGEAVVDALASRLRRHLSPVLES
jgi:hypothetical protein